MDLTTIFVVLILIVPVAYVLAIVFAGVAILCAFVYGIIMAFVGWLLH